MRAKIASQIEETVQSNLRWEIQVEVGTELMKQIRSREVDERVRVDRIKTRQLFKFRQRLGGAIGPVKINLSRELEGRLL